MKYIYIDYNKLPNHLRDGMRIYIEEGYMPGHFLTAVLENNLSEAIGRADDVNIVLLPAIVQWVYNEAPGNCWGSPEKVRAWHDKHWPADDPRLFGKPDEGFSDEPNEVNTEA